MSKYRKKPVVIEAEQWFPGRAVPGVVMVPCDLPKHAPDWPCADGAHPVVRTLEGDMNVSPGDWIVTGVKGEKYPCKPDIFEATYEPVGGDSSSLGLEEQIKNLQNQKNGAYAERNQLVALLARMARELGWNVWRGRDTSQEEGWHNVVFIELPTGQASWHFHDSETDLLKGLPWGNQTWDGHTTDEKYERVQHALAPITVQADMLAEDWMILD